MGLHRVERLMRAPALHVRPRRRALPRDTGARSAHATAPNLLDRDFTATAPNQKWVADLTYLWTAEGWLYVAVVLTLFSRRVVGWSMQASMTAQLVTNAGNVWDNAVMERFFSTLKTERTARKHYATRDAARADVFDFLARFYNPIRRHSTLGYLSPMEFEQTVA